MSRRDAAWRSLLGAAGVGVPAVARSAVRDSLSAVAPPLEPAFTLAHGAPDPWGTAWQVGVGFFVVVGLFLAGAYVLRRTGWHRTFQGSGVVRVLERAPLAPRKSLVTVQIAERTLVLGVTDANIQTVLELDAEEYATSRAARDAGPRPPVDFARLLRGMLGKRNPQ